MKKSALLFVCFLVVLSVQAAAQYHVSLINCTDARATRTFSINDNGMIAGAFQDANGKYHAMVYRDGACQNLQPLLPPEFVTSWAYGINSRGDIVGTYAGSGFLIRDGVTTLFDFPGAIETGPQAISDSGVIVGYFITEENGPLHGFIRDADGNFSELKLNFDSVMDVLPWGVNARGDVSGDWDSDNTTLGHAFVIAKDGTAKSFDAPSSLAPEMGTFGAGINERGDVVGYFLRQDGSGVTGYAALGNRFIAIESPTPFINTLPSSINNKRVIVGNVLDANGRHGFIAMPIKVTE